MSREKQIEEMKTVLNNYFDNTPMELSFKHENEDTDIITDEKALGVIDAITRQALIPVFCEALYTAGYRKQSEGEWIQHQPYHQTDDFYCSLCGAIAPVDCLKEDFYESNFCPNCGAKMFVRMTHTCPHNIPNLIPTIEELLKGGAE